MVVCQWLMGPTLFQSSTNLPSCLDALILRDLFFCQKKWGRDELRNCNFSGYHRGMNSWSPWSCYIMIVVLNGVCYIHRGSSENWEAHTMGTILGSVDCLSIVRLLGLPKEITFFFESSFVQCSKRQTYVWSHYYTSWSVQILTKRFTIVVYRKSPGSLVSAEILSCNLSALDGRTPVLWLMIP